MRIGKAFGLQPHRQETRKLSKDPQFIDKLRDVVGLYLNPPERAVVLGWLLIPDRAASAGYLAGVIVRTWLPATPS
jgi:hypothetical protein